MKKEVFTVAIAFLCFSLPAYAEISESVAVQCILGEARGEGKQGIRALAQALRNRGKTSGVYGCGADFKKEMPYIRAKGLDKIALDEWRRNSNDIVHGADHWGSTIVDKKWIAKMNLAGYILTASVNNHEYYRRP